MNRPAAAHGDALMSLTLAESPRQLRRTSDPQRHCHLLPGPILLPLKPPEINRRHCQRTVVEEEADAFEAPAVSRQDPSQASISKWVPGVLHTVRTGSLG